MTKTEKKFKILIVEDEWVILNIYRLIFQRSWFDVEVATNGIEAYAAMQAFLPDIILLDIMLPDMNGFETLTLLNQDTNDFKAKIIILSNLDWDEDKTKAMELWAIEYLIKSDISPYQLVDKVKEHLVIKT